MIYVEPAHLGQDGTETMARRMVELLREREIEAEYVRSTMDHGVGDIPDAIWEECLDILNVEFFG